MLNCKRKMWLYAKVLERIISPDRAQNSFFFFFNLTVSPPPPPYLNISPMRISNFVSFVHFQVLLKQCLAENSRHWPCIHCWMNGWINEWMKGNDLHCLSYLNHIHKASSMISGYCLKWTKTLIKAFLGQNLSMPLGKILIVFHSHWTWQ